MKIIGPSDSPYEDGVFYIEIFCHGQYPIKPPYIRFYTKIYHSNIDRIGRICLDILKDKWSPSIQLKIIGLSLITLLGDQNFNDPYDQNVGLKFKNNYNDAFKIAKEWTKKYAIHEQNIYNIILLPI